MKNLAYVLVAVGSLLVAGISYGAGPLENQGHRKGVAPLDHAGELSGQVINLNRADGVLEVRTAEKGVARIQLDREHPGVMDQLKEIKPGDKVLVTMTMKAVDLKKNGSGEPGSAPPQAEDLGGSQKAPAQPAGKLTGQVVGLDRSEKSLDIRMSGGGITHLHLDEEAKGPWKNMKPGDQIEVTLTMEATSITPKPPG